MSFDPLCGDFHFDGFDCGVEHCWQFADCFFCDGECFFSFDADSAAWAVRDEPVFYDFLCDGFGSFSSCFSERLRGLSICHAECSCDFALCLSHGYANHVVDGVLSDFAECGCV